MDYHLSEQDRRDMFAALIIRFRLGEIGPVTFRAEARRFRIAEDEINTARDLYIDDCAKAMRSGSVPFASGARQC